MEHTTQAFLLSSFLKQKLCESVFLFFFFQLWKAGVADKSECVIVMDNWGDSHSLFMVSKVATQFEDGIIKENISLGGDRSKFHFWELKHLMNMLSPVVCAWFGPGLFVCSPIQNSPWPYPGMCIWAWWGENLIVAPGDSGHSGTRGQQKDISAFCGPHRQV